MLRVGHWYEVRVTIHAVCVCVQCVTHSIHEIIAKSVNNGYMDLLVILDDSGTPPHKQLFHVMLEQEYNIIVVL